MTKATKGQTTKETLTMPAATAVLSATPQITLAEEDKPATFEMVAYCGGDVLTLAGIRGVAEIAGIEPAKAKFSVRLGHDPKRIVGQASVKSRDNDALVVAGNIFKNRPAGEEVVSLAHDGFEWEGSVNLKARVIERIGPGRTTTVNGKPWEGPGVVFRKSRLVEVSFCDAGYDPDTKVSIAAADGGESCNVEVIGAASPVHEEKENEMAEKDLTLEALKRDHADLVAAIAEETRKGERGRITGINEVAANFVSMGTEAQAAIEAGETVEAAALRFARVHGVRAAAGLEKMKASASKVEADETDAIGAGTGAGDKTSDEAIKAAYDKDPKLQKEFLTLEAYAAYTRGVQAGRVDAVMGAEKPK